MASAPASSFVVFSCAAFGATLALFPAAGFAQSAPLAAGAPPAVVGWLAQPSGTVWVAPGAGQPWQPALANQPLESGDIVATAPDGEAAIGVMAMRAVLGPSTELAIDNLGAGGFSATETAGEVALDLSELPPGAEVAIATPRGTVEVTQPGRYEIAAGAGDQPTLVTAFGGAARMVSGASVETVYPGQTAILSSDPDGTIGVAITAASPDPLLRSVIASSPSQPAVAPPEQVAEMTGGASLAAYGAWSDVPTYGTVWFPDVPAGWVPYRDGRWVYVAPWGWTWVDADPWGFAPFHYGRWVQLGPRWGWLPVAPGIQISAGVPIYAPALVNFFAAGSVGGVGFTVSAGALAGGMVGWVPLGPDELYRPPFAVSPTYIRRINVYNVRNINRINIDAVVNQQVAVNHFVNRRALTTVSFATLADARQVAPAYRRPRADTLAAFRSLPHGAPVRPGPHAVWPERRRSVAVSAPLSPRVARPDDSASARPPAAEPYHRPRQPEQTFTGYAPLQRSGRAPREPAHTVAVRPPEPPRQAYARPPEQPRAAYARPPEPQRRPAEASRSAYVRQPQPPRIAFARPPQPPRTAYARSPQPPRTAYVRSPEPQPRAEAYRSAAIHAPVRPRAEPERAPRPERPEPHGR
ncbi:MAG: DUF6600 domain-containing protein [Acetobacteraceae bacterium]